ncbi:MAG: hypothetical protein COA79_17145 [Planctomycetota bacterium]|nr:MAG: hypothetical protein COA79_17145 [Planctomycetota bacterium]
MSQYSTTLFKTFIVNMIFYSKNIFTPILISNAMGLKYLGAYNQILATINLLIPLSLLSLDSAYTRFSPSNNRGKDHGEYFTLLLAIFLSTISLFLIYLCLSNFLLNQFFKDENSFENPLRYASLLIISEPLFLMTSAYFRANLITKHYNSHQIIYAILFILNTGATFYHQDLCTMFILQFLFTIILILTANILIIKKSVNWRINFKFLRKCLFFSAPIILLPVINWIINSSDIYFITYYLNLETTGIYSTCYTLSMVIMFIYSPFYVYLIPKLKILFENDLKNDLNKLFSLSFFYPLYISFPITICIYLNSDAIVSFITGERITGTRHITLILLISYMLFYSASTFSALLKLSQKTKHIMLSNILAMSFNILANFYLIPILGMMGAAISTLASFLLMLIYTKIVLKSNSIHKLNYLKFIYSIILCFIIYWIADTCLGYNNESLSVSVKLLINFLVIATALGLFIKLKIIDIDELKAIKT